MILHVFFRKDCVDLYRKIFTLSVILIFPFSPGCALFGGGSETLHRAKGYKIRAPNGWTAKNSNSESDSAFQTASGNVATLTSSCQRNANASLDVLTRHLLLGARNTTFMDKKKIAVAGREGQHSSIKTTLDGSVLYLELFVLPKEACVFDFSLVSNKEISEKERTEFISFFKSFTYGSN